MKGTFLMQSAGKLYYKAYRDYKLLKETPADSDVAFNFFITAYHITDWLYPDDSKAEEKGKKKEIRENVLIGICGDIANSSKHFVRRESYTSSVEGMRLTPRFTPQSGLNTVDFSDNEGCSIGQMSFAIDLSDETVKKLEDLGLCINGSEIEAVDLAEEILKFWKENQEMKSELSRFRH